LDYHAGGFISVNDLKWLDGWQPVEWLLASPDQEAWAEIRERLETKFGHLLRAWRFELDADNSNQLSWTEFKAACERLKLCANIGGAWRYLDTHRLGCISLHDFDKTSADTMSIFQEWAEVRFGSLPEAFNEMDSDGGGTLSRHEFGFACLKFKNCPIDSELLFDALSSNGKCVSKKDFNFLNAWRRLDDEFVEDFLNTTQSLWDEVFALRRRAIPPGPAIGGSISRPVSASPVVKSQPGTPPRRLRLRARSPCIPADFALGKTFPRSPYADRQGPTRHQSHAAKAKHRLRKRTASLPTPVKQH